MTGPEPQVRSCAKPIVLTHSPRAHHAVVCLHGYTGYPGELALPAKRLYAAGFDVYAPRYPGHGTNGKDFLSSNGSQWLAEAERQYREVAPLYKEVSLVGHSMGGAIAVIIAQQYSVRRMVLYAPALVIPALPVGAVRLLSLFVKRKKQSWSRDPRYTFFDERDADDDEFLGAEYWSWNYPRQLLELERLRKTAADLLPSMQTDTLVFTGGEDQTVPQEAGILVVNKGIGKNNWIHLPKATHLIPYDRDAASREEAMDRTVSWFTG